MRFGLSPLSPSPYHFLFFPVTIKRESWSLHGLVSLELGLVSRTSLWPPRSLLLQAGILIMDIREYLSFTMAVRSRAH